MKLKIYDNNTRFVYNLDEVESQVYDKDKYLNNGNLGPNTILKKMTTIDPELRKVISKWGVTNPEECFIPYDIRVVDLDDGTVQIELAFYPDMAEENFAAAKQNGSLTVEEVREMEETVFKGMDKFRLVDAGLEGSIILMYENEYDLLQIANKTRIPVSTFQNGMNACILAEHMYNIGKLEKILKKIDGFYTKVYFAPHNVIEKCRQVGINIPIIKKLPR